MLPYTFVYVCILSYTATYLQISSTTIVRANIKLKNGYISVHKPFPKMRTWHTASQYVIRGSSHPKVITSRQHHEFWGDGESWGIIYSSMVSQGVADSSWRSRKLRFFQKVFSGLLIPQKGFVFICLGSISIRFPLPLSHLPPGLTWSP